MSCLYLYMLPLAYIYYKNDSSILTETVTSNSEGPDFFFISGIGVLGNVKAKCP